jgi:hypothetical protein
VQALTATCTPFITGNGASTYAPLHQQRHPHAPPPLYLPTGEDAIRHLFSRGTHVEFGYSALLIMLVFYFLGAAWTGGWAAKRVGLQCYLVCGCKAGARGLQGGVVADGSTGWTCGNVVRGPSSRPLHFQCLSILGLLSPNHHPPSCFTEQP